ncbi:MAG: calcium-binding protein [Chitinophagales bacterium]|nr:calcium-binding protein [Chitinophagales bacterium]
MKKLIMKLTKSEIQEIIEDKIIVDCYDEEEVNLGWAIFMEDNIHYPFEAEYQVKFKNGKHLWTKVKVINNESSESNFKGGSYYVKIGYKEIIFSVKLEELRNINADEETLKAIQVWNHRTEDD